MDATTATLLAGAVGAILGAGGSVLTVLIQSSYQRKRDTLRLATEIAVRDREKMIELAKESGRPYKQLPLVIYLHYHVKLIELIESGDFAEASYEALVAEIMLSGSKWSG